MNEQSSWGIIGLGWLGKALAAFLDQRGVAHWGTTTSDFNWKKDSFPTQPCEILFLNTPPLTDILPNDYVAKIYTIPGQRIVFVSSISVYGNQNGVVTESTAVAPKTASAQWLVAVENLLREKFSESLTVIRPGGLIGGDRHPIFSLSKSGRAVAGNALINFIHRDDLVQIIFLLSRLTDPPSLINAVCPYHPTKREYYGLWSYKLGLSSLSYSVDSDDHKTVVSEFLALIYPKWIHPQLDSL